MYNKLLVSYDLLAPGKDYEALYKYFKQSPGGWAKPLESLWIIKVSKNHETVRDELRRLIDSNDKLIVIDITGDAMAWYGLSTEVSQWLRDN